MRIDTAMIFAAGFGTRMQELTVDTPKPMLKLGGVPMIDHTIRHLKSAGVDRLFANTHYLPDALEAHLAKMGVITLREDTILETGGGLKAAIPELDRNYVITMNPDVFWVGPNPVPGLLEGWNSEMSGLLMLTPSSKGAVDDFSLEHGEIARKGPFRYTGLQILRTDLLAEISETVFSLNTYWDFLLEQHTLHGLVYEGTWADIGTAEGFARANRQLTQ